MLGGVGDDVADDPHRRCRRVDVGVAHHELFQDVVLNGSRKGFARHTLLLGGDDVACEDRQHRTVHRHRHRHLIEGNTVEENLHVLYRIDRHPGHADITGNARVIRVIPTVRREIKRHRDALSAAGERLFVKGIRLFGSGKPGVLANCPWPTGVHRGLRTPNERFDARHRVAKRQRAGVVPGVERFDEDAFRRRLRQVLRRAAF